MAQQYKVLRFVGVPVAQTENGLYKIKTDQTGQFKLHEWRIGKHTKGHYQGLGQIFITENHMRIAIVAATDVPFKKRHQYQPMARFLPATVSAEVLARAQTKLEEL
ncbi:hypothetical protein M3M39_00505 [Fructilactobacillus hinvesii]|uniref:DUF7671 domain-containing protein n=1 Tax=Fructilactobacillus hinvesii TaxID=2940300 RepID=A0ABY5BSG5_9LACO|nr:hypothetical protein [Fructilactobacillus hinvesii]USS88002.1 hypothetical protein M3M39_00505 [Fructilactobacillus hinvesii]